MPRADLDALEHMAFLAEQEGHAKYARLLRSAIAELRALRECDAAGRAAFPGEAYEPQSLGGVVRGRVTFCGEDIRRVLAARAAVDAMEAALPEKENERG